jgi:hypothetical protein
VGRAAQARSQAAIRSLGLARSCCLLRVRSLRLTRAAGTPQCFRLRCLVAGIWCGHVRSWLDSSLICIHPPGGSPWRRRSRSQARTAWWCELAWPGQAAHPAGIYKYSYLSQCFQTERAMPTSPASPTSTSRDGFGTNVLLSESNARFRTGRYVSIVQLVEAFLLRLANYEPTRWRPSPPVSFSNPVWAADRGAADGSEGSLRAERRRGRTQAGALKGRVALFPTYVSHVALPVAA